MIQNIGNAISKILCFLIGILGILNSQIVIKDSLTINPRQNKQYAEQGMITSGSLWYQFIIDGSCGAWNSTHIPDDGIPTLTIKAGDKTATENLGYCGGAWGDSWNTQFSSAVYLLATEKPLITITNTSVELIPSFPANGTPLYIIRITYKGLTKDIGLVKYRLALDQNPTVNITAPRANSVYRLTRYFQPIITASEVHYPNQTSYHPSFEPAIVWTNGNSINSNRIYEELRLVDEVKPFTYTVRATNIRGWAEDSRTIYFTRERIAYELTLSSAPDTISIGDTVTITGEALDENKSNIFLPDDYTVTLWLDESNSNAGVFLLSSGEKSTRLFVDYIDFKNGKIKFIANGTLPHGKNAIKYFANVYDVTTSAIIDINTEKYTLSFLDREKNFLWPYLPPQLKDGKSRGANKAGYNPEIKHFRILLTDASGNPVQNKEIEISSNFIPQSNGHNHTSSTLNPPQNTGTPFFHGVFSTASANEKNPLRGVRTDINGLVTIENYGKAQISGYYLFTVKLIDDPSVFDTMTVKVAVPNLVNLRHLIVQPPIWDFHSNTEFSHPEFTWISAETAKQLFLAITDFYDWSLTNDGGGVVRIIKFNDISLPYGGVFDFSNNWNLDKHHSFHRIGESVDINDNYFFKESDPENQNTTKWSDLGEKFKYFLKRRGGREYKETSIHFGFNGSN